MPSFVHEILIELFRSRPDLAPLLAQGALHVDLPAWTQVTVDAVDFSEVQPAAYRADLTLVLGHDRPVFGLVVEVQLGVDRQKPRAWVHYANSLAMRDGCPTAVLVVAANEAVARRADRDWDLGHGLRFRPLVLRNRDIPAVTDLAAAAANPSLAVLSASAHGREDLDDAVEIAMVMFLEGRGLLVSEALRTQILGCRDSQRLDRWLRRAGTAASAEDLVGD